jgi:hypothetical protein
LIGLDRGGGSDNGFPSSDKPIDINALPTNPYEEWLAITPTSYKRLSDAMSPPGLAVL